MKLTLSLIQKIIPEFNRRVVTVDRIIRVFYQQQIEFHEVPMYEEDNGAFVTADGKKYIFIRYALRQLIRHQVILHEGIHGFMHVKAHFLQWRQQLEADALSLVGMMPLPDLPHLNRLKGQLEPESYELLMRRNQTNAVWGI